MQNLHKMNSSRNHAIVIVTILALSIFALNLPYPPYVKADVKAGKVSSKRDSSFVAQAKTIERRNLFDDAIARLSISPGHSPGESEFAVEQIQLRNKVDVVATGKLRASGNKMRVIINDAKTGLQLSLKSQVDLENPGQVLNTLSFNGATYKFAFDIGKARTLTGEIRELLAEGKRTEANRLGLQITRMLAPDQSYLDFVKQVSSSSAFDALTATASLLATATPQETNGDFTLLAITYATKLLAPSAWMVAKSGRIMSNAQQQKPQIVQVSFPRSISIHRWQPPRSSQVQFCCSACVLWLAGIIGCLEMFDWCVGAGGGSWCELFLGGCIAGDVALAIICAENCTEC